MDIAVTLALIATLAGNAWMIVSHWPALARALAGPQPLPAAPQRPPAEVVCLSDRRREAIALRRTPALRLAA